MAEVIRMPKMSDTMTDGVIVEWHKKVGDVIKPGDILADVETDKATMELENYVKGVLLYIGVEKGGTVPVDSIIAIVGNAGDDFSSLLSETVSTEAPKENVAETKIEAAPVIIETKSAPIDSEKANITSTDRIKASPLAKKIAQDLGYNLQSIAGSGDGGRIIKQDVESYTPIKGGSPFSGTASVSFDEVPVSQMRKIIAKRLAESKFSAPHFYLTIDVDMDNAMEARKKMNEFSTVKISFNDFVVKACALSLVKHPVINSSWLGDKIRINHHVNIGIAVAVEDGLLVPVVRNTDTKSLSQISSEVKTFGQKAKDKKLQPSDWEGNTFTISNLGMFGIEEFTAIINTPDACILAVGAIRSIPVVKKGQVVPGNKMKLTLSCDHRVVDGASGAAFLQSVRQFLEEPVNMLV